MTNTRCPMFSLILVRLGPNLKLWGFGAADIHTKRPTFRGENTNSGRKPHLIVIGHGLRAHRFVPLKVALGLSESKRWRQLAKKPTLLGDVKE